ncbi:LuxR C-terminal-related transcriptional regulator [Ottowia sp.]|uniref:helix-turn-helix transcriptional regulator n=1 Tax=Ottowia sp. TaxID=1898956 RepID=UPI00263A2B5D|nr:LuxR C-terminal-related transcriptional regulator [Ottowia sp.]
MNLIAPSALRAKYRVPRQRREVVERTALLRHTLERAEGVRLVLVQAPAGFGKTTLLAQLAAALGEHPGTEIVWVSLDTEDNDANRFFAALFNALAPLNLPWAAPPASVLAQLQDASPAARAALGLLLDALGARSDARIVLVLDDLHHVTDESALNLLDMLIAQAPPEVQVLVGSRTTPALSLARWRVGGELVELGLEELQFDLNAIQELCRLRKLENPSLQTLEAVLERTNGWVAGVSLMLGSTRDRTDLPSLNGPAAHRHLFDYLAQEVLSELPTALQQFALYSSVLPEISPALCQAVTGRSDARAVLHSLFDRQLFMTALDEAVPVLRFHDLFRDFLRGELERREPGRAVQLHGLAAAAETRPERAVPHWIAARRWPEALTTLRELADGLLAVGGTLQLERWLEHLPEAWRASQPDAALLRGMCAWSRWDWIHAKVEFQDSLDKYSRQGRWQDQTIALSMLGACHNALGNLDRAREVMTSVESASLPPPLRVGFDSLLAWHSLACGDAQGVTSGLSAMADSAAMAPEARYPNIVDMSYGHFTGVPRALTHMERLRRLCRGDRQAEVPVPSLDAWLAFWHGESNAAQEALHNLTQLQRRLPGDVMLTISTAHLRSLHLTVQGQFDEALGAIAAALDAMAPGYRQGWLRTYRHVQARIHWRAEDAPALGALLPELTCARTEREWPVLDTGAAIVGGQHALLTGELTVAREHLERAVLLQQGPRMPVFMSDARVALAMCNASLGNLTEAARVFDEVLSENFAEDGIGLLLEPPKRLMATWRLLEPYLQSDASMQARLLRRMLAWQPEANREEAGSDDDLLSAREREVLALLAEGQSNKLIARALDLSVHTVKRHVANILTKLALDSRTQAAAYWHKR